MISQNSLKTGKMDELLNGPVHLVGWCDYNSARVITSEWQQTTVMEDEAIWWKCPACQGWHLSLMRRDEPFENAPDRLV